MLKKSFLFIAFSFAFIGLNAQYKDKVIPPEYLFKDFTSGEVYLNNTSIISTSLNFNTLNQEMLFKKDSSILKLNMPGLIDSIVIENRVFIPFGKNFYEIIAGSKLKLLVQNRSRWDTQGEAVGYGFSKLAKVTKETQLMGGGSIVNLDPPVEVKIYDDSELLIFADNKMLSATMLKNYIDLFPNSKKDIQSFAKKNKLNLRTKNDIIKLVQYINKKIE